MKPFSKVLQEAAESIRNGGVLARDAGGFQDAKAQDHAHELADRLDSEAATLAPIEEARRTRNRYAREERERRRLASLTLPETLRGMTSKRWAAMSEVQRAQVRDLTALSPQLTGHEGWRVEVLDYVESEPRRFIVGRSTGWRPVHLEIHNRRSHGGGAALARYFSVRFIEKVR